MDRFSPVVREWFTEAFPDGPTLIQERAWDAIASGGNALVIAPTGSGKTLAAFLSAIDKVSAEKAQCVADGVNWTRGVRILYVSPMKALGADVERNLTRPLAGILRKMDAGEDAEVTMAMRTGDTTPDERRRMLRNPPDILITTPESLYLMLTSRARDVLATVETVIVDEIHALAPNKRGAHLALSLERLDDMLVNASGTPGSGTHALGTPAQRIGLSATVRPPEEVARFLGGEHEVAVIEDGKRPDPDIEVRVPVPDMTDLPRTEDGQSSIWPFIEGAILDEVEKHSSTIVFVNSRGLCERLTSRLNELYARRHGLHGDGEIASLDSPDSGGSQWHSSMGGTGAMGHGAPPLVAKSHHGSVSKDRRTAIERELKSGQLPCVVATSSLELGIDMGDVDLVIQVAPPLSVSSGLQRIGRANHQVGGRSHGIILPRTRLELIDAAVASEGMREGDIEDTRLVTNALDVLAQQTVAAVAMAPDGLVADEWFATVRRAANYASLTRGAFDSVIAMLSGAYGATGLTEFSPRIIYDAERNLLLPRPGSQRLAVTGAGTIPDRGLFPVMLPEADAHGGRRRVGELDEEMVAESRVGDVITLGTSTWRITEIGRDRVLVEPAPGRASRLPFWHGEQDGRPFAEGIARGMFVADAASGVDDGAKISEELASRLDSDGLDAYAKANLAELLVRQRASTGKVPTDRVLVVEQCADETGDWSVILHSPFGRKVHAPWALAISSRISETLGFDPEALASDDGIMLKVPLSEDKLPGKEAFLMDADQAESLVRRNIESTALFAQRFRECAARALTVTPPTPGKRAPLWQQRLKGAQLLEAAIQQEGFPLLAEAARECLTDAYDITGLREVLDRLESGDIRMHVVRTGTPSPFCASMLFGYVIEHLYEGDLPHAERRASALAVDPALLSELLGVADASELIDPRAKDEVEAILQRTAPWRRVHGAEGVADLLTELGPLSAEEVAERVQSEGEDDAEGDARTANKGIAHSENAEDASETSSSNVRLDVNSDFEAEADGHVNQAQAMALLKELQAGHRAFQTSLGGRDVWMASTDAAIFLEALGVEAPDWAVSKASLAAVPKHPMDGIVARYANTHSPFSSDTVAKRFGVGDAMVRDSLGRLEAAGRVERYGDGLYVTPSVMKKLHSRTRALAEAETEPMNPYVYMDDMFERQGLYRHAADDAATNDEDTRAIGMLADTIAQFEGLYLKPSAWEDAVFPARVPGYRPHMLDELLATGEVVWRLDVRKGAVMLAFYPTDSPLSPTVFNAMDDAGNDAYSAVETYGEATEETEVRKNGESAESGKDGEGIPDRDERYRRIVADVLGMNGPSSFTALFMQVRNSSETHPETSDIALALCTLAIEGMVACDSFECVRAGLFETRDSAEKNLRSAGTAKAPSSENRMRRATSRRSLRSLESTAAKRAHREQNVKARAFEKSFGGNWMLLAPTNADYTMRALGTVEGVLDCYGVVTRDILLHAGIPGAMSAVYPVLRAMEDAGELIRGALVEGMGPAQFASRSVLDAMRARTGENNQAAGVIASGETHETNRKAAKDELDVGNPRAIDGEMIVIRSDDPAWLYGEGVPWPNIAFEAAGNSPALDAARLTVRPKRKDGSRVVVMSGCPVLLASAKCKDVIAFTDNEEVLRKAFEELLCAVRRDLRRKGEAGMRTKVVLQTLNGIPMNDTPVAGMLKELGLVWVPEGMRLYVS